MCRCAYIRWFCMVWVVFYFCLSFADQKKMWQWEWEVLSMKSCNLQSCGTITAPKIYVYMYIYIYVSIYTYYICQISLISHGQRRFQPPSVFGNHQGSTYFVVCLESSWFTFDGTTSMSYVGILEKKIWWCWTSSICNHNSYPRWH